MAKELQKTLKLENEEYNINAVYSDEAGKVSQPLTIKKSLSNRIAEEAFNGSEAKTIEYVPVTGGKYKGPVLLDTNTTDYVSAYNSLSAADKLKTILNVGQINTKVADLVGAPLYTWNDKYQLSQVQDSDSNNYKLNTIIGATSDFNVFKKLLTGGSTGLKFNLTSDGTGYSIARELEQIVDWDVVIPYIHNGKPVKEIEGTIKDGSTGKFIRSAFYENTNLKSVAIPDSVETIGNHVFSGCTNLISANIPDKVKSLPASTFFNCEKLKSVKLGKSIELIGETSFNGCESLESIMLPEGVTEIGARAFQLCESLKSIVIPSSVTKIGKQAFSNCPNLETVYYSGSDEQWNAISISDENDGGLSTANTHLKTANRVPYAYSDDATVSAVNINEIADNPFIYICKDTESASSPASNNIFLKLPGNDEIVEVSKGAARLESTEGAAVAGHYTYETLAAIIAGINSRLAALGSKALELPEILTTLNTTVIPEAIPEELKNEIFVEESAVPTVQELEKAIDKICGISYIKDTTLPPDQKVDDIISSCTDSLATIRNDLDTLAKEVEIELKGELILEGVSSRLDSICEDLDKAEAEIVNAKDRLDTAEDKLDSIEGDLAAHKDNISKEVSTKSLKIMGDDSYTRTLKIDEFKKLFKLIDCIDWDKS